LSIDPIVLIPARMAAQRLPGKPLADIGGEPMIVRVARAAVAAGVGPVCVAAGDVEIVEAVQAAGLDAVLTDPGLPSGSDRIMAALAVADPDGRHDVVINVQGDMPFVSPAILQACEHLLRNESACDIATVVAPETSPADRTNPDVVKAIVAGLDGDAGRALYFTRGVLYGEGPIWRHVGIYG
jgi:3-deoxy-manno-octulosonate cytidylyltransferase (CMP-KDO synthetase)